jgi:tetratricopeptide (TPR) repeat protein
MDESSVAAFKNVKLGETAPNFTLKEVDGKDSVTLENYYEKNKVIIVAFWATWSPRSINELKDLKKIVKEYGDKGVGVIAVNVEKEEPTDEEYKEMKKIKKTLETGYKLILDSGLSMFHEYGVVAVPSTVILDGAGVIKKIYDGYPTSAILDMRTDVEVMLGLREYEEEVEVVEVKGPKILKAAKLHYGVGRKLMERGMGLKSVNELEKAAKLDKNYDLPLVLLGEVYEAESVRVRSKSKKATNRGKAVDAFSRAIERNDQNLFAYSGLVRVHVRQGDLDKADEVMKTIFKIDSNFITGIIANGILLQAKNKDDEAIKEFKRALEYNRNMPEVYYLMAKSYEKQSNYKESITSLKESFRQLVKKVQLNKLQEKGNYKESITSLKESFKQLVKKVQSNKLQEK